MIQSVRLYIEKHKLLAEGNTPVLVGLSGGADSVALLGVLVKLRYNCIALHCNFHLRGEEADRDENFAREFATSLGVSFYKTDFDTTTYAKEHQLSIEMAARELRYAYFETMCERLKGQAIAVAHHQDDSVETVLLNLIRGTGIRGLSGINPRNGKIVRPLLCVSREEILAWLAEQRYTFITDSSNLSDIYKRNFIRLRVLPLLEKLNPSVKKAIARSAEHVSEAKNIYTYVLDQAKKEIVNPEGNLSITALSSFPAQQTILYELLKEYGFTRLVVEDIFAALHKEPGKTFYSPTHRLVKDRDTLLIVPLLKEQEEPIHLTFTMKTFSSDFQIEKDKHIAYFDHDQLQYPLSLRRWKEGDWFIPFGMKGRKKLSDYFSDHKFSKIQKEQAWLLCSGDAIIWIVGERADDRYRIKKSTKNVLIVNFSE